MRFMTMWIYKNTLNSEDSPEPNSHSKSLLLYYRYLLQSSSKNHENFEFLGYRPGRNPTIEHQE